ncbi:hypothetical protein PR001_g12781 [Phytophthora rubi]|uniref:Integrase zinc-binding domain-containing protein n=2 Tax=Phytophthora rubi TaxID=129364 RepID=A0A6A3M0S1_9STRA|nr:hypothetical protein PR001_g12781 [Phytophthora rubi]
MVLALKGRFYITKVEGKVAKFVRQCLLCKYVTGSRLIPRPYGPLLTPTERNEVVHWDFLSLGEGYGDSAYLLVVKDGLSHFRELFPCATPTAYVAAEALLMWAPVSSRSVYWSPASSALDVVVAPASETTGERIIKIGDLGDQLENLRASLRQMHREETDAKERKRLQDMMTQKGTPVNFDVGDFVLWSRIDQRLPNNKLLGQWVGPFKVIEALPHSFKIEHLVTGRIY